MKRTKPSKALLICLLLVTLGAATCRGRQATSVQATDLGCTPPGIDFTVPPIGSQEDLQGTTACVEPADYRVAVFIFTSGWYNKPTWSQPLTAIASDGSWICDITTGPGDEQAARIAAFLVPKDYTPPEMNGQVELPEEVNQNAVAKKFIDRPPYARTVQFSGYTWGVKASTVPVGPGNNYFSDDPDSLWVDPDGRLHLKIANRQGTWYASEVVLYGSLGYGTYSFTLASRVDLLDPNVVLGLFTWDDTAPAFNYREIDIEFSRWGSPQALNSQFVVQPYTTPANLHRYNTQLASDLSTHSFEWGAEQISFKSLAGTPDSPGNLIEEWVYTSSDNPPPGLENTRINLWLLEGKPPASGEAMEVIVERFEFTPPRQAYLPSLQK